MAPSAAPLPAPGLPAPDADLDPSLLLAELRRARQALHDREQQIDLIEELAGLGSWEIDLATDAVRWSREQRRIHGVDDATAPRTHTTFMAMVHPDDRAIIAEGMVELSRGTPLTVEYRVVRPDGAVRLLQARARLVADADGRPTRVLGTSLDITERRAIEQELREAYEALERRVAERTAELAASNAALAGRTRELEGIFHALPDLYFRLDADLTIVDYRASSSAAFYVPPDRFLGRRLRDVMPADICGRMEAALAAAAPGALTAVEYQLPVGDLARDYEARLFPLGDGTRVSVVRDITDAKDAERALRERETHFRRLIENSSDYVMVVDTTGAITYVGPSVEQMLGYTPEEMLGGRPVDLVHPDDVPHVMEAIAVHVASPGTITRIQYRMRHKDGRWRIVENVGRTVSPHNVDEGLIANCRDITERVEAERALRERDERFRRLIENAADFVVTIDPVTGVLTYVPPSSVRLLGWAPEELLGRTPMELLHPDDVEAGLRDLGQVAVRPGEPVTSTVRLRHKDGSYRVFESVARTLSPDSVDEGVIAFARDVTARIEAERALRERDERFRRIIENASDFVMMCDATGALTFVGPSSTRLLGYAPHEILGTRPADLLHPDDVAHTMRDLRRIAERPGEPVTSTFRIRHKDGRYVVIENVGRTVSPEGIHEGVIAFGRDVTDRHAAQAALQRSEEHFRRLIENGSDIIMLCDAQGVLTYVSPSVRRIAGYDPASLVGATPAGMLHPDDIAAVLPVLRRVAEHPGTVETTTYRVRHANGEWRVFETVNRTLLPDSAEAGLVANARDITEQRAAEHGLRRATAEAEQARAEAERQRSEAERANQAKSEFLSRMSHELRTPMNSILGFAQLLARIDLPAQQAKGVQHILKAGRHLLRLINEVLEIARIEAGRENFSLEPVALAPALEEALGLVRPLAQQHAVALHGGSNGDAWPAEAFVLADRQRLVQVLLNLLSNAIKYNHPGGAVHLRAGALPDGGWAVRVEDTGRGIPTDRAHQLFTPFARLGAEQTEVEGTGLGLALSRRLCEAMGSTLALESSTPAGSVFRVALTGAESPLRALEDTGTHSAPAAPHRDAVLLYVEDNLANLSLVETILISRPGWRTIPALQGQLGVELAREHRPDVVLLDLHLPDINGDEVLRRLRADPRTARIPVVVVSADATTASVERLRAAGADAYLTKPLDVDEFLAVVERFLPAPRRGDT
ncbi:MAG TPA: PAS domain S-box protein [Gemmatirosa sp.]|nr:PAS domain S-box protein [Gemmatirosa sp.]